MSITFHRDHKEYVRIPGNNYENSEENPLICDSNSKSDADIATDPMTT